MNLPKVSDYLDYRQFLKDHFDAKKAQNKSYSYRVFAQQASLGSSGHLKMVIDGQRNLTQDTLPKYIQGLKLTSKKDVKLFELLVKYNQCKDPLQKSELFQDVIGEKNKKGLSALEKHQYQFMSSWYHVVIYVMADLRDFQANPDWIYSRLRKKVSKVQIDSALEDLKQLGLLKQDHSGKWIQSSGAIDIPDAVVAAAVPKIHDSMLTIAKEALRDLSYREREFNVVTIPVNKNQLENLKDKIEAFRKEINEYASNMEDPDEVYQLNIQLMPMTRGDS